MIFPQKGVVMGISPRTRVELYQRSEGRCECEMKKCSHSGRCPRELGMDWEFHYKTSVLDGGTNDLGNLLAMCPECHKTTRSYGR
jgi:hypothetical protein